jgi:general stress protein 26
METTQQHYASDSQHDLVGHDAVEKLKSLVEGVETCFMRTNSSGLGSDGVRPMGVRQVDEFGNLWFLSSLDSHKNQEISTDSEVELFFQGSSHSEFLHVKGHATLSRDPAKIKELWGFLLKTWFTEGEDDPRITVIKVVPASAYYWDTKHGATVAGIKMLIGAVVGKTMDDGEQGSLKV